MRHYHTRRWTRLLGTGSTLVAGVALAAPSQAQETAQPEQAARSAIEEIVVTAARRASSLQDVPIAVTAMDMDALLRQDIRNANDLAQSIPGLNIGVTVGNLQIGLRGVSNDSFFLAGDPTVAFHVDGVYRGRQTGGNALFMDLERVEVLKGPQGTLYGRNATAGSINVITRKPEFEFGGHSEIVLGNFNRAGIQGALNVPVSDKLAFRAAYIAQTRGGYYENGPDIDNYGDSEEAGVRLHGLYNISERSSLLLTFDWQGRFGEGDGSTLVPEPDAVLEDFITGEPYEIILNTQGERDDDFYTARAEFNHTFDAATLTYLGAYYDSSVFLLIDFDRQDRSPLMQTLDVQVDSQQHSHEIQLASNTAGPLEWLIGGFLFFEDAQRHLDIDIVPPGVFINNDQPNFEANSQAVFGQATYALTDALNLTGGLRWTHDRKSEDGTIQTRVTPGGTIVGTGDQTSGWTSVDWTVGLDWHVDSRNMLYAKVGTGYKSGGFNDPLLDLAEPEFDPEEILAVQIGQKSQFLDGRLQINSEGFWYDYTDLQVNQIVDQLNIVRNAAEARIYGFDTEILAAPTEQMRINFAVNFLESEYREFSQFEPIAGVFVDLAGKRLRQAPKWSLNMGLEYVIRMNGGWELIPAVASTFQTETKHRVFEDPGSTQPAFHRTNASLTLDSPDRRWQLRAFATNLQDNFVATNIGLNGRNERTVRGEPPLMFGMRLRYNFGGEIR